LINPCRDGAELPGSGNGQPELTADAYSAPRKPGVLIADDEARLRALLIVTLRRYGFAVWMAADGAEAVETFRDRQSDIDLVVLDTGMPGLDGCETLKALRNLDPNVRCCFTIGTSDYSYERDLLDLGAVRIFQKPFKSVVFAYMVWQLIGDGGTALAVPCRNVSDDEEL
jgi:CheY-like chemotaxis protein